jgi:hypothetical protein
MAEHKFDLGRDHIGVYSDQYSSGGLRREFRPEPLGFILSYDGNFIAALETKMKKT